MIRRRPKYPRILGFPHVDLDQIDWIAQILAVGAAIWTTINWVLQKKMEHRLNKHSGMLWTIPIWISSPTQKLSGDRTVTRQRHNSSNRCTNETKFNIEAAMERLKVEKTYLSEPIGGAVYIHGDASARSIVKSAFVLAVHSGVSAEQCETVRNYLKEPADSACWWFYYDGDLIPDRPKGRLFHCVAIKGNPATRQWIGYVEFFGAYRMLVLLSSEYGGKEISNSYTVDPTTGEELSISPNLELPPEEVFAICRGERYRPEIMTAAINQLMAIAHPKKMLRDRENVMGQAVRAAVPKLGYNPMKESSQNMFRSWFV
jgi:hypothetical protein